MSEFIQALREFNIPLALIVGGMFFLLLAIAGAVTGGRVFINVSTPKRQIMLGSIGAIFLCLGFVIAAVPVPSRLQSSLSIPTPTPTPTQASVPTSTPSPTPTPSPYTFTSPKEGSSVPVKITVHGTAPLNIPPDKELWLLVESGGVNGYFPQGDAITPNPIVVSSEGKWDAIAYVGTDTDPRGTEYVLHLALVDKNSKGRAAIDKYFANGRATGSYKPIYPLPDGIHLVAEATVTRA